jgi:hypothetical protein
MRADKVGAEEAVSILLRRRTAAQSLPDRASKEILLRAIDGVIASIRSEDSAVSDQPDEPVM